MKESNFYSDDFEQLIRDKTEQYKMYPSERVWKGVHNSLHTKRRWFIGSMSLLVTGILFFAGRELISTSGHSSVVRKSATSTGSLAEAAKPYLAAHLPHTSRTTLHSNNTSSGVPSHSNIAEDDALAAQDPAFKEISITLSHPVIDPSDLSDWLSRVKLPDHAPEIAVIGARPAIADAGKPADEASRAGGKPGSETPSARDGADIADADGLSARAVLESLGAGSVEPSRNTRMNGRLAKDRSNSGAIGADALIPDSVSTSSKASATTIAEARDRQRINWLHDYAMNTLPAPIKRGRTYFQLTLAPTVNYRSFSGVDPSYEKLGPLNGFSVSPSQLLNHSSALGFEFGGSILYRLTRNLSVKGGLQFNFARYKITAFTSNNPNGTQSSSLNSYLGYVVDSVGRGFGPNQRSTAGSMSAVTLNNDYYQLSAPVGFELRVLGNERLQFNIGATVQPSYLLGTTSYMLTDYMTKYSKDASMYRKWNVSGGVEAFLSYRVGNIRWQIGPEFRYQFLSTYTNYPIKENLKTYGLKIGITKMLP